MPTRARASESERLERVASASPIADNAPTGGARSLSLRSLDLTSGPAKHLVEEALAKALSDLRANTTGRLSSVRVLAGAAFVALSVLLGLFWQRAGWAANLPFVLGYTALAGLTHLAMRRDDLRDLLGLSWPFLDVLFVVLATLHQLPLARHPEAVAGWSGSLFAFVVVLAALTLRTRLILVATLGAWAGQSLVLHQVNAGYPLMLASGVVLGLVAAVTARGVERLEGLAARLVSEEVARRMAIERGEELELANDRIARVNTDLEGQHTRLALAQRDAETMSSLLVHDMKQPLSSIQGILDLVGDQLAMRGDAKRLVEDLGVARSQGDRLLAMIADLLAIARLERGLMRARKQRTEVAPLLRRIAQAHGVRASAQHVEIAVRAPADLTATFDRELVERCVENLISNALTFAHGGVRVEVSAERSGPLLLVAVRNSGPCVPEDVKPHLFEKFVTRDARARHNAGLGLYFCRLVAEAHGGSVALEDDAQWPVSFVARMPADVPEDTPPELGRLRA